MRSSGNGMGRTCIVPLLYLLFLASAFTLLAACGADAVPAAESAPTPGNTPVPEVAKVIGQCQIGPGAQCPGADFSGQDLSRIPVGYAQSESTGREGADFTDANLRGANFTGANLKGVDFAGADLRDANFSEANLTEASLYEADASGADFTGASLENGDFKGANLSRAELSKADLSGASLNAANLSKANLYNADLRSADLRGANLRGADLLWADLQDANLDGALLNWSSHELIVAILQQAARGQTMKIAIAGGILISHNHSWDEYLNMPDMPADLREWAISVLKACVHQNDDDEPPILR